MREFLLHEIESMSFKELKVHLIEQERALHRLAKTKGFSASASEAEFKTWAESTTEGKNIASLSKALKNKNGSYSYIVNRLGFIVVAFLFIAVFMWLKSQS